MLMNYVQNLQSSFDTFISQIQFQINSFLAVFGILAAIAIGVGIYVIRKWAQEAASAGVKDAQEALNAHNILMARIDAVEKSQEDVRHYVSDSGVRLYNVPLAEIHSTSENNEYCYYGKIEHTLYVSGSFQPCGPSDQILLLPFGFRPNRDTNLIAVPCNDSCGYKTIRLLRTGEMISDIPASDVLYTFQAYLEQTE